MTDLATAPQIVQSYFQLAVSPDINAYAALFADDARVEDEGRTYAGVDAIRVWRRNVPRVAYAITGIEAAGDGLMVTATLSGDFPGSPIAGYRFHFEAFDQDHLQVLRIMPPAG